MSMFKNQSFIIIIFFFFSVISSVFVTPISSASIISGGNWQLLQSSIGISAMHVQILPNNKAVIFDRTDFGPSNLSLPEGSFCPKNDCTAHSVIYDIVSNTFRPLHVLTDTWCSSGALDPIGTLIQTGGYGDGDHVIRTFTPCDNCDWYELNSTRLIDRRWYATNQILPDGRIIIIGGRRVFTYEFYPKTNFLNDKSFYLRFLVETRDPEENNLYPFLHLLPDGNLFIFANRKSILFDYKRGIVLKQFPLIPGDDKRNYPSTGSSVMLPLRLSRTSGAAAPPVVEVLVCGGAPPGAFMKADKMKVFVEASRTCGRLRVNAPNPQWLVEPMPMPRVMSDMILLPTGDVIIINGAANGTAGWENAVNPALNPVLYSVNEIPARRFTVLTPSKTPRMYHSIAALLPDGRILVGGSNPHTKYVFKGIYPTELSLEAYNPYYLDPKFDSLRPSVLSVDSGNTVSYGKRFGVSISLSLYKPATAFVALISPSFTTHSIGMNQRMVVLYTSGVAQLATSSYKMEVDGPTNANVAPPGYYMMFVVHSGIPSQAVWVKLM